MGLFAAQGPICAAIAGYCASHRPALCQHRRPCRGGEREAPVEREVIHVDVLIVGGGPAGLAAAIRLADLARNAGTPIEILLIEKGSTIGAHSLSGAVVNPSALRELLPDVAETEIPFESPVTSDRVLFLTGRSAFGLPFHPPYMGNRGYYVASLGKLTRWLAGIAEQEGCPGLPRLRRPRTPLRGRARRRRSDRGHRDRQAAQAARELPAGHGHPRPSDAARRGRSRPPRQGADPPARPRRGPQSAGLLPGCQGAVGGARRDPGPRGCHPYHGLSASLRPVRRWLHLRVRPSASGARPGRRTRLRRSGLRPAPCLPGLQAASLRRPPPGGWPDAALRRQDDPRGGPVLHAQALRRWGHAARRLGGLPQPAEPEGDPPCHSVRHAGRARGLGGPGRE